MMNYEFTPEQRLRALEKIFEYAKIKGVRDDGTGEESYNLLYPFCSAKIIKCDGSGFLFYAASFFVSPYNVSDFGGFHDTENFGLRHMYHGSEDGLLGVGIEGILRNENSLSGFPGSHTERLLREEDKLTPVDKMIFDELIKHAAQNSSI